MQGTRSKVSVDDDVLNKYPIERKTQEPKVKNPITPKIKTSSGTNTDETYDNSTLALASGAFDTTSDLNITEKQSSEWSLEPIKQIGPNPIETEVSKPEVNFSGPITSTLNSATEQNNELQLLSSVQKDFSKDVRYVPKPRPSLRIGLGVRASYQRLSIRKRSSTPKSKELMDQPGPSGLNGSQINSENKVKAEKSTVNTEKKLKPKRLFTDKSIKMSDNKNSDSEDEPGQGSKRRIWKRKLSPVNSVETGNLRAALNIIPEFDGKRENLDRFIAGLENGLEIIGDRLEGHLLKLAQFKLIPAVWKRVSKTNFDTIEEFVEYLRTLYDPPRDIWQLTSELGNALQKDGESVDEFAFRIQQLGEDILTAFYHQEGYLNQSERDRVDKMTVACFKKGLKMKYRQNIRDCETLREAIVRARSIEREYKEYEELQDRERPKQRAEKKSNINFIEPEKDTVKKDLGNAGQRVGLSCQLCRESGHTADKCYNNPKNNPPIHCQLCKKQGHIAKNCPTIAEIQQQKSIIICQICEKPGHSADRCYSLSNATPPVTKLNCQLCDKPGHTADRCFSRPGAAPPNPPICQHCGKIGHTIEKCYVKINAMPNTGLTICQLCGKRGHSANKCFDNPCQICGRKGHLTETCNQNQQPRMNNNNNNNQRPPQMAPNSVNQEFPKQQPDLQCYECQGWGHVARDCVNRNRNNFQRGNRPGINNQNQGFNTGNGPMRPNPNYNQGYNQGNGNGLPGTGGQMGANPNVHPTFAMRVTDSQPCLQE